MKISYIVERSTGNVNLNNFNLFLKDTEDMVLLEEWETRLDYLKEPYVVAYRKSKNKIKYSVFVNSGDPKSAFFKKRIKANTEEKV